MIFSTLNFMKYQFIITYIFEALLIIINIYMFTYIERSTNTRIIQNNSLNIIWTQTLKIIQFIMANDMIFKILNFIKLNLSLFIFCRNSVNDH